MQVSKAVRWKCFDLAGHLQGHVPLFTKPKLYIFCKAQVSVWLRHVELKKQPVKTYWAGWVTVSPILNIRNCSHMRVIRQTKALTVLPQGKCPPYSLGRKIRDTENRSRRFGEEIYISYLFRVSNPRFIGRPAQSLVILPSAVSRCLYQHYIYNVL
jgi:hypothetical protein